MSKVIDDLPEKGSQVDDKRVEAIGREPTSEQSSLSVVIEDAENIEPPDEPPALAFSKGRCIALVLTVTGASFINVSWRIDHATREIYSICC